MRTGAVASAAPSPSCGSDLRECLRQSAEIRQTTFGGRYVTAEDVARCVEAFASCIHGGASGGGNPNPRTSTSAEYNRKSLPQRFGIRREGIITDCTTNGASLTCTETLATPIEDQEWSQTVTGTMSGLTMTGTVKMSQRVDKISTDCFYTAEGSGPATYVFQPDGAVEIREGPMTYNFTYGGSCAKSESVTHPEAKQIGTWSASR